MPVGLMVMVGAPPGAGPGLTTGAGDVDGAAGDVPLEHAAAAINDMKKMDTRNTALSCNTGGATGPGKHRTTKAANRKPE